MPKIRIVVIDDSSVTRRMLAVCLNSDPDLEVVATAADGQLGLAKIEQFNPDVIVLDVEMPIMDGLQTLKAIRKASPRVPVIMFSTLTSRGAGATIDALTLGASDYLAKPGNLGSPEAAMRYLRDELTPKIKRLGKSAATNHSPSSVRLPGSGRHRAQSRVTALVIGVSTGGPSALATLLPALGRNFPAPVLIVQHMPPVFTRSLAERLGVLSAFNAREGEDGARLKAGDLWVAPGGLHMEVVQSAEGPRLRLHEGPHENSCRPAVDVLFRSAARVFGAGVLAVVLTGMGHDGLYGAKAIQEADGQVLVQDEASSVVWGMPGAVFRAGLADKALSLDQLPGEINQRVQVGAGAASPGLVRAKTL